MTLSWDEVAKGSIVQIRSVEDMIEEFGRDNVGEPRLDLGWCPFMAISCGLTCRVVERARRDGYTHLTLEPEDDSDPRWGTGSPSPGRTLIDYSWSIQMVESVTPVAAIVVEAPEVSALLQLLGPPPASAIAAHPR